MSSNDQNRVLNRVGARELTQAETEKIAGSRTSTVATAICTLPGQNSDIDQ